MQFQQVTQDNIEELYKINRELAIEENQESLFTASLEKYRSGFVGEDKCAYGILAYQDADLIGFAILNYKFATYLGYKALYIEDIFLKKPYL